MTFAEAPTLTHAMARLEQLSAEHAGDLIDAVAHDDLSRTWYTAIPGPTAMAGEIDRRLALQRAGDIAAWAVVDPGSGRAVGMTTYLNMSEANRALEIGSTWIGVPWQGTGINAAAKLLLLERAFDVLGCIRVEFRAHWHNQQSRRAVEKLGAKPEGVLRSHKVMADGHVRDTVVYSVIEHEWPVVRRSITARLER